MELSDPTADDRGQTPTPGPAIADSPPTLKDVLSGVGIRFTSPFVERLPVDPPAQGCKWFHHTTFLWCSSCGSVTVQQVDFESAASEARAVEFDKLVVGGEGPSALNCLVEGPRAPKIGSVGVVRSVETVGACLGQGCRGHQAARRDHEAMLLRKKKVIDKYNEEARAAGGRVVTYAECGLSDVDIAALASLTDPPIQTWHKLHVIPAPAVATPPEGKSFDKTTDDDMKAAARSAEVVMLGQSHDFALSETGTIVRIGSAAPGREVMEDEADGKRRGVKDRDVGVTHSVSTDRARHEDAVRAERNKRVSEARQ